MFPYRMTPAIFLCVIILSSFIPLHLSAQPATELLPPVYRLEPPLSPRNANYEMDVRLDVQQRRIEAVELLTWRNISNFPVADLQFHLYYNAWRNDATSFLNSVNRRGAWVSRVKPGEWASIDIKRITLIGSDGSKQDVTDRMTYIQPEDGNPFDRTVMRVPLAEPLAAGETIQVEIEWESHVSRTFARTGALDDYFFIAQWFPKIGVLNEDGSWNCHQFIQTEFFADYGVYDVRLTVPAGWVVGATGVEIETKDNPDGTTTHRFYQEDVHDFVWTTSPHYRVFTDIFEEPGLPPVRLRLLLMPDHLTKKERYFEATKFTLKHYGTWFGPYPYGHLTIVDPAYQSRVGGMEYPTLFTGGTQWLSPRETLSPEGVTVHECGHQFWYGIVGNNEFEDAWLDEGFNTYSTYRVMAEVYPRRVYSRRYLEGFIPVLFRGISLPTRADGADRFDDFRCALKRDRLSRPAYQMGPGAYRVNAYDKAALMLQTLENYLGWDVFQKVLSTYFERWKFKHPRPQDFFAVVNEVTGRDMSWFFEQTYNSSNVFDYAVGEVISRKIDYPRGNRDRLDSLALKTLRKRVLGDTAVQDSTIYQNIIFVQRWGEATFPAEVQMVFSNGDTLLEQWDGLERWHRFEYLKPARVTRVEVDPRHILVLDINRTNNSWTNRPMAGLAARKWAYKWMVWLQNTLEFFAFFN